jgi:ribonuclease E
MMANRMLIDASHPEETRVVVQRGNRIEEFDFESASRKQLRGNIYLAKVTRVEPSLQAAFVDYGGNRHGFLAFSEIHPDYYQIPVADRQALLDQEARDAARDDEDEERSQRRGQRRRSRPQANRAEGSETVSESDDGGSSGDDTQAESGEADGGDEDEVIEQVGSGDALDEVTERVFRHRPHYKIQEVIKRRQILLVQVVKEERGSKGAALTTYLSLAGRYSVLMPNTARGGGISRKITNATDRKRLKSIAQELDVPEGMGVILRTAGAARTKLEVKRDFEYLLRVWETVRELTLQSTAPNLVYEEGSLIKRAIRDLYSKDIEDIHVAGDDGYREAKDFMKMLMPSQAKVVKHYREPQPVFARFGVEAQLDAMFSNTVTLKSGGYIVINPTEALVSIDVNSGRATREHNIEDTALKTNCEAADEVARQLRLRDLAGLIVIDFIDMEEKRNNRTVEKRLKDALKNDRARIQVGRISHFGLMEMSRQRIRTGVLESSTSPCPHCGGTGFMRSTQSVALLIVRGIEESLLKNNSHNIIVRTRTETALYVLNQKRLHLRELEKRFGVTITVLTDDNLGGVNYYTLERGEPALNGGLKVEMLAPTTIVEEEPEPVIEDAAEEDVEDEATEAEAAPAARRAGNGDGRRDEQRRDEARRDEGGDGAGRRRRRRRRRRGRGGEGRFGAEDAQGEQTASANGFDTPDQLDGDESDDDEASDGIAAAAMEVGAATALEASAPDAAKAGDAGEDDTDDAGRRRRRGRRGGRRNRSDDAGVTRIDISDGESQNTETETVQAAAEPVAETAVAAETPVEAEEAKPKRRRRRTKAEIAADAEREDAAARSIVEASVSEALTEQTPAVSAAAVLAPEKAEIAPPPPPPAPVAVDTSPVTPAAPEPEPEPEVEDPNRPKRTGWWAKAKKALGA